MVCPLQGNPFSFFFSNKLWPVLSNGKLKFCDTPFILLHLKTNWKFIDSTVGLHIVRWFCDIGNPWASILRYMTTIYCATTFPGKHLKRFINILRLFSPRPKTIYHSSPRGWVSTGCLMCVQNMILMPVFCCRALFMNMLYWHHIAHMNWPVEYWQKNFVCLSLNRVMLSSAWTPNWYNSTGRITLGRD